MARTFATASQGELPEGLKSYLQLFVDDVVAVDVGPAAAGREELSPLRGRPCGQSTPLQNRSSVRNMGPTPPGG